MKLFTIQLGKAPAETMTETQINDLKTRLGHRFSAYTVTEVPGKPKDLEPEVPAKKGKAQPEAPQGE